MLHIHFANRFETLAALLMRRLADGRGGPFDADSVVVPSAAVQRALTLAIADHHGICANVRFDYLARWLWQQIGRLVPGVGAESPFDAAVLSWRVHAALADAGFVAEHPRLANYLGSADAVMRFEFAQRVAALLEQYVTYRADWLDAWQHGRPAGLARGDAATSDDERWQAALWRRLVAELGLGTRDPAAAFVAALRSSTPAEIAAAGVPSASHVFALPAMPPLHLDLLQQLGRAVEVHLYVLNPCQEYWFELIDPRRLSHLAARGRAAGHEVGNRLLASWGRQTQAQIDGLIEHAGDAASDDGAFEPNPAGTLLAALQNAVLELTELAPGSIGLGPADRSLELHVCHSLTRELEVLHDRLLGLFVDDPALRPSDILVVIPELEAAAPLIDAVFGTVPAERRLPYAVTGRARSRINAPARALLGLLALAGSRFAASAVFGWLQQPIVARRFGLDDAALEQVQAWMQASGMRWGIDASHRAGFDLPADPRHTLADGLDRLFLGHALPSAADAPFDGRLPAGDAEGSEALALGAFWAALDALGTLRAAFAIPQTPTAWAALLGDALESCLAPAGDEIDDQRELQDTIAELVRTMQRAGLAAPLPLAVLRAALEQRLDDPARGGVPTGSITFASMSSLRNLPYRVVCALGLDDGVFPGSRSAAEFDLMAQHPRRGDRQRRDDERNLFLDLLLAARERLHLSHTGRSVRDNAPRPPSVLVAELLDTVLPALAGLLPAEARARLVVEHPLQPFSLDSFALDADPRRRSFDAELAAALRHGLQAPAGMPDAASTAADDAHSVDDDDAVALDPALPAFFTAPLSPPGPEWREVSLAQLVSFFRHPSRTLLRQRLGLELPREADTLRDNEPFLPEHGSRVELARRLLPPLLEGADAARLRGLALAGSELPGGALGERELARELVALGRFGGRVRVAAAEPMREPHAATLAFEIDGEAWRLHTAFADLRPAGLVRWRFDAARAGDLIESWLHHLALAATPAPGVAVQTSWLMRDETLRYRVPEAPHELLRTLLRLYRRGLREPLHFFSKTARVYSDTRSLDKATQAWLPTKDRPFAEGADPSHRLALRGHADPLDHDFAALADTVYGPLREHLTREAAS